MKKTTLLKSMLLLCALVVGSTCAWADETYTIGWGTATGAAGTYTNFTATSGTVTDIVSFSTAKNDSGSNPAYNSGASELRLYYHSGGNGGSITLTPAVGVTITGAVVTTSTEPSVEYSVDGGAATSVSASSNTYTVSGIEAKTSLTFQNANTTNTQLRIKTIQITYTVTVVPEHTATFNVNGTTDSDDYKEGEDIVFPAAPAIDGLVFMGWTTTPIVGTTDTEPAEYFTSGVMGDSDITYYAVFAKRSYIEGNVSLTITTSTENLPGSYGTANTFTEYTFEGKKFKVQQMYKNGTKLQWRASGNDNGTGTMYNSEAINKIQSVVLTYDASDGSKNFTLKVGDAENPTDGTDITPTNSGLVYTYDCSSHNKNYFVLTNGTNAGYLTSIEINYLGDVPVYSAYRTSIPTFAVSIGSAKYATFCDEVARDFSASGITVYAAAATASSVEFDEVIDGIVPANTGVVLFSETTKADVAIPVATSAASYDFSSNEMIGVNAKTLVAYAGEGSKKNYILANGASGVGFYKAKDAGANLAAHKAYLSTDAAAASRDFLGFEDETTGIEKVEVAKQNAGEFYNLAGQRVANPTKGLYIVNGKKIIK